MKTNNLGIKLMHQFEGLKLKAYLCPAKVWTIGYGNTRYEDGTPVKEGDVVTLERAEKLFLNIVDNFEKAIRSSLTNKTLNDNQFSALVCFAYNVGMGNFNKSTLLKLINRNPNDPTIRTEFLKWNKAGGKELSGLTKRRQAEADLYFKV
jgi:lysozyme